MGCLVRARGQVRIRHRTSNPENEGSNPPGPAYHLYKILKTQPYSEKTIKACLGAVGSYTLGLDHPTHQPVQL